MAAITLEGNRLATRDTLISASPMYSNVTDVIDYSIDKDDSSIVWCLHSSGRISRGNGVTQTYLSNMAGNLTVPASLTNNLGFVHVGTFTLMTGPITKWFVAPAATGVLFIGLQYSGSTFVSATTMVDTGATGATKIGTGITTNTTTANGSGKWYDIIAFGGGVFKFLNQSPRGLSSMPVGDGITNTWKSVTTGATDFTSFSDGSVIFNGGTSTTFPDGSAKPSAWPSLGPVLFGTRNFTSYSNKPNPFAFEMDGTTPKADWASYSITSFDIEGAGLGIGSATNYLYIFTITG